MFSRFRRHAIIFFAAAIIMPLPLRRRLAAMPLFSAAAAMPRFSAIVAAADERLYATALRFDTPYAGCH